MIELKLCITEAKKGIGPNEKGVALELVIHDESPTLLEAQESNAILTILKCYMEWTTNNRCVRSAHLDGGVKQETYEAFINQMGVDSIKQRNAKKNFPGHGG